MRRFTKTAVPAAFVTLLCCMGLALVGCGGGGAPSQSAPSTQASQASQESSSSQASQTNTEDMFTRIDLERLESILSGAKGSADECLVYIARDDCNPCIEFEQAYSQEIADRNLPGTRYVYFTNDDREGPNAERMYSLLDDALVAEVPCIFVAKDGKVIYKWDSPTVRVPEIVSYLETGNLPSSSDGSAISYSQDKYTYKTLDSVDIRVEGANVQLQDGHADDIVLCVERLDHPGVNLEEKAGSLVVSEKKSGTSSAGQMPPGSGAQTSDGVFIPTDPHCTLVLFVPDGITLSTANLESDTGNVTTSGPSVDTLDIKTGSGTCIVEDSNLRTLNVKGKGGNVEVFDIACAAGSAFDIQLDDGEIQFGDIENLDDVNLDFNAGTGNVTVFGEDKGNAYTQTGTAGSITAKLGSGTISILNEEEE